ncbi:MAG TPA: GNAT family protein [Phenylobacterium sp.]
MPWPDEVTLENERARLEPLRPEHAAGLAEAVKEGELWRLWYTKVPAPDEMSQEIERRLALRQTGMMAPFAVRDADGRLVGMTTYCNIDPRSPRVEIGYTWYGRSVQRTALNTACKRMLLAHAFEELGCIAVEFRTNAFNHASRRAIERLGAKLDGVLRSHQLNSNGTVRDTYVYSIVAGEWPSVRTHLDFQLERAR